MQLQVFQLFLKETRHIKETSRDDYATFSNENYNKFQISDSSLEKLNCLNNPSKFLKEHIANTNVVISTFCSELLLNLGEFFSSSFENAEVKQVIVHSEADPYRGSHLVLGNLNHKALLATNPAFGHC